MAKEVNYRDPSANDFPDDYDQTKVDPKVLKRTQAVREKMYGKDVREAMAEAEEITSAIAVQARDMAESVDGRQRNVEKRFDEQIAGSTNDNEIIDARNSSVTGETSPTLKKRLDDMQKNGVDINKNKASDENAKKGLDDKSFMTPQKTAAAIENQIFKGEAATTRYIAHRGNNADYPENSAMAFESVTRHWGIETDISVTKDGHWVIMHDLTLDRMTNGTGAIAAKTLEEIKKLQIDSGKNLRLLTEQEKQVPTLLEFLAICKRRAVVPVIEIKQSSYTSANFDTLVDNLQQFNLLQGVIIISYGFEHLQEVKKRLPIMPVQLLTNNITDDIITKVQTLGANVGISSKYSDKSFNSTNVRKAHDAGLSVCAYTVPEDKFETLTDMGVDYITTNSKSGDRRFADLTPIGDFAANNTGQIATPYVEEQADGKMQLYFGIEGGSNARFTNFLKLPKWAIPAKNQWNSCTIKEDGDVTTDASFDIIGKTNPQNASPGDVRISYGWEKRSNWAHGNVIYSLY